MTTIDITEHLAQFTAVGLIVVDGIPHANYADEPNVAPPLWRKLIIECNGSETCLAGVHIIGCDKSTPADEANEFVGMRPIITLTTTCECAEWEWNQSDDALVAQYGLGCDTCNDAGVVTLGRFTINLVQIPPALDDASVEDQQILNAMNAIQILNLSKAQTGQWAVQFKKVES